MKPLTTYVITLSQTFPATHPRKGEPTYFEEKAFETIMYERNGTTVAYDWPGKYHTIRGNYELWRKRFDKIDKGEACLSIRIWTGKPYASPQREIARLTKEDGIGLQKMEFLKYDPAFTGGIWISGHTFKEEYILPKLANNDGLSIADWEAWFKSYDLSKPLAIIHFTNFRY